MKYFQKALNIDGNNIEALSGMGQALSSCHQYYDAERYLRKALSINPEYVPALELLGAVFEFTLRIDEAIKYYEKAIESNVELVSDAYMGLSRIYFEREELQKA